MKVPAPASCLLLPVLALLAACMKGAPPAEPQFPLPHPAAETGMRCGTLGNITMKFPSRYNFLGVTYVGVDYWDGTSRSDAAKWCDDQLQEATFSVIWPGLAAATGASWFTSTDPKFMAISVSRDTGGDPGAVLAWRLQREAGDGLQPAVLRDRKEIEASKAWSDALGLYMIDANTFSAGNRRRVFWQESGDGVVSLLITCTINVATRQSRCSQLSHDQERNAWMEVEYRIPLLSRWRDLDEASSKLVESFTIAHGAAGDT